MFVCFYLSLGCHIKEQAFPALSVSLRECSVFLRYFRSFNGKEREEEGDRSVNENSEVIITSMLGMEETGYKTSER